MQRQKKQTQKMLGELQNGNDAITYGIIGIPKSKADVMNNIQQNVKLGLDLRGGSHLILQVQVQDAVKAEADQTIERLKDELNRGAIDYASLDRNDPMRIEDTDTIQVNIKGV